MRLRTKFLLYAVLPAVAIQGLGAWWELREGRTRALESTRVSMTRELQFAADEIERGNREAVLVARSMALAQEAGLFGRREETVALCRKVAEARPDFVTTYVLYEPDADGQDARERSRPGKRPFWNDDTGRFVPALYRDPADLTRIEEQTTSSAEMETSPYYDGNRKKFASGSPERYLITEPYDYLHRYLMVEQTCPIVINGKFAGIAGVDRSLDFLDARLLKMKPYRTARFFLVSSRGRIVASTLKQDIRTMRVADLRLDASGKVPEQAYVEKAGMKELDEAALAARAGGGVRKGLAVLLAEATADRPDVAVREVDDPIDGGHAFVASARVPTGGWTLVMTVSGSEVLAPLGQSFRRTLLSAGLTSAVVVFLLLLLARNLSRRLLRAVGVAQRVAAGDLTADVGTPSNDEPGRLLGAIGEMNASLRSLVGKVRLATDRLLGTARRMETSAGAQEKAVRDLSVSTSQIAAALEEIAARGREVARTVEGVRGVAAGVAELADDGRKGLSAMETELGQLAQGTASVSERLAAIRSRTGRITSIVTTIVAVADRTNLLSLNASIEAEKAGPAGLGFAVIAGEIRRLADETAVSTFDIERNVGEMQGAVSEGLGEIERLSAAMEKGTVELRRLARQMQSVLDEVESLHPKIAVVTADVQAQAQGVDQISEGVRTLAVAAQETAGEIQGFRAAGKELGTAVELLGEDVSRFKVTEAPPSDEAPGA